MNEKKARIAVLVSGGGTNLQALIDAQNSGIIHSGEIVLVVSNKAGAYALERAAKAGIKAVTLTRRECGGKEGFVRSALCLAISWGLGYALCWACKWLLAAAFLQENVWPYVGDDIAHRLGGNEFIHLTLSEFLSSALGRNIGTLFPLEYGAAGVTVFVTLIVMYAYILYVYRGKGADSRLLLVYLCIAAVPYVRYMVLHNHSYLHYFFTHRAQLGTVLALVLILCEAGVGRTMASHVSTLRRKGRR